MTSRAKAWLFCVRAMRFSRGMRRMRQVPWGARRTGICPLTEHGGDTESIRRAHDMHKALVAVRHVVKKPGMPADNHETAVRVRVLIHNEILLRVFHKGHAGKERGEFLIAELLENRTAFALEPQSFFRTAENPHISSSLCQMIGSDSCIDEVPRSAKRTGGVITELPLRHGARGRL